MKVMRYMRRILIVTAFATLWGQGVTPRGLPLKAKPADYEVSGDAGKLQIGATYMGRTFAAGDKGALHDAGNFIVVEIGVFASKAFQGELSIADFQLRIDGKKLALLPVAPGLVSHTLRNREMDPQRRRLVFGGGMGNGGIVVGAPRPVDNVSFNNGEAKDWDAAVESGIPEGVIQGRAGNLFFEYSGKMTKVKSLILAYDGPGGKLELKLR
jgi:hypothetical protein